jgi:hypothetical protein
VIVKGLVMSDTKFTSGPWVKCSRGESLVGSNGKNISVYNCGLSATVKSSETVANAHLIAAAPDMYKALVALSKGEGLQPGTTIESILIKARGE